MARRSTIIAGALIVVAGLLAYANSFHGPFVLDDPSSITTNPTIRHLWPPWAPFFTPQANVTAQSRPILNFSLALNYAVSGNAVWSYHTLNLVIHLLAALVLFGCVRRTLLLPAFSKGIAPDRRESMAGLAGASAALLWVVHPLNTESVTYVIQRAESLMGLFYLLGVYCFARACESDPRGPSSPGLGPWAWAAVVSSLLCMATKEVAASLPIVILLYDRAFVSGSLKGAIATRGRVHLAIASTWIVLAYLVLRSGGNRGGSIGFGVDVSPFAYGLTQFEAIGRYLLLSLWPHPLVFEYGAFSVHAVGEWLPWAIMVVPLAAAGLWALIRNRPSGFIAACFFLILAPTSLVPGTSQMIVEHRMYLPLAAVLALVACGITRALAQQRSATLRAFALVTLAVAAILGGLTASRNAVYASARGLWEDTLSRRPANPLAHYMLAEELVSQGALQEAESHYDEAIRLNTGFAVAHERLGELCARLGKTNEAQAHFEMAITLRPQFADAHNNLGSLLAGRHEWARAREHLSQAVLLDPASAEARYNLATVEVSLGHPDSAIELFTQALSLKPEYPAAQFNLANTLASQGKGYAALAHYAEALRQKPQFPAAHYNMGNLLVSLHRIPEAIAHYEAALALSPNNPDVEFNLASALLESGRLDEAEGHYLAALKLDPGLADARENLRRIRALRAREQGR